MNYLRREWGDGETRVWEVWEDKGDKENKIKPTSNTQH